MNKNEKAFVNNLIQIMEHKKRNQGTCEYCYELLSELRLLQIGKVTDFQVRQTNLIRN